MTNKRAMLDEMKKLDKAIGKLSFEEREQREIMTARFNYLDHEINSEPEVRTMQAYEIRSKIDEIIDDVEDMDQKNPKMAGLMTQYNDSVRQLFEREKAEIRRGDRTGEAVMLPLYTGDVDSLIKEFNGLRYPKKEPGKVTVDFSRNVGNPAEFRNLFHAVPRESSPFRDAGDFFKAVLSNQADPRLEQRMVAGVGSLGGVVVPTFLVETVLDRALEDEIIRPRAKVYPMTTTKIEIPNFNSYSHTSNRTVGGFIPVWGAEGSTSTAQDAQMSSQQMETKYLSLFSSASIQLLTAAPNFENILQDAMSRSVADTLDSVFFSGLGAGTPRGLLADPARVTITRTSASTVQYSDLTRLYSRMYPPQLKNAVWLANPSTLPALMNLTTASGNSTYVIQDPNTGTFRIMGKELLLTEKLPELGTENDIMLADLTQYNIALVPLILFDRNSAPGWFESTMHFRLCLGVDGQGSWETYVTPKNGSTQSWLVGLK